MFEKVVRFFTIILLMSVLASCSEYNKVLKSSDNDYRFTKAEQYFNEGKYTYCITLLEDLIAVNRGTAKFEKIYYYYAKSHYLLEDYISAVDYFKNFTKTFPKSSYAEECGFLAAMCSYYQSPKASLDQAESVNAIGDFQLFLNRFPESSKRDTCNLMMIELRNKLEKKSFENAKIYYQTERYKSAVVALNNTIKEYPNTKYEEEILYMIVKSNFELASNSVEEKQKERFEATVKSYQQFIDKYAESKRVRDAENIYKNTVAQLERINKNLK